MDFEKDLHELEAKIAELKKSGASKKVDMTEEVGKLEEKAQELRKKFYADLSP